jgi:hypothetical protein
MKKLRLLGLVGPALLLVPVVACEDSSSSPAAAFTFEAGPGFEAGPPAEGGPLTDAGAVDGADVFVPPAPKGVTVTVIDSSLPKANVRVISQDAKGAVIGDAKTDATGKLTLATAPSMVTVLATSNSRPTPVTFFAVTDGDNLAVRIPPSVAVDQAPVGHYSVSFTPAMQGASIHASVFVGNGCSNSTLDTTAPVLVDLFSSCIVAANAVLGDGSNTDGNRDGFAFKKSVAAPAANATSNVLLPAWTTPGATTLVATHVPAASISNTGSLFMIANGAAFPATASGNSGPIDGAGQSFQTATGFADAYQSFVRTVDDVANFRVESSFIRREATAAPASVTLPAFDFTNALPYITNVTSDFDTVSAARPIIKVTSDSPLTGVDAGVVVLGWTNNSQVPAVWTFVLPASSAATFEAPALPVDTEAQTFTPFGASSVSQAVFFEATQLPSYQQAKAIPIVPMATFGLLDEAVPLPADGTVRLTSWSPAPPPPPPPPVP